MDDGKKSCSLQTYIDIKYLKLTAILGTCILNPLNFLVEAANCKNTYICTSVMETFPNNNNNDVASYTAVMEGNDELYMPTTQTTNTCNCEIDNSFSASLIG